MVGRPVFEHFADARALDLLVVGPRFAPLFNWRAIDSFSSTKSTMMCTVGWRKCMLRGES